MFELSAIEFRLDVPKIQREELRAHSMRLFDEWNQELGADFAVREYSLRLEIEEEPVVGLAVVTATLGALYAGIGTYPSFVEGINEIQGRLRSAAHRLVARAHRPFASLKRMPRITRRAGVVGQLQRLLHEVKRREIEVEEAMVQAQRILGPQAPAAPAFIQALADGLSYIRCHPDRFPLPKELTDPVAVDDARDSAARAKTTNGTTSPPLRPKVEVWRDSLAGMRWMRITETW